MTDVQIYGLRCATCPSMTTDRQTGEQMDEREPGSWLVGFCSMHGFRVLASETCGYHQPRE